jgi:Matrixin/Putative Ig domain
VGPVSLTRFLEVRSEYLLANHNRFANSPGRLKISLPTRALLGALLFVCANRPVLSYELTGQTWPIGTSVTMQLELGPTNVSLLDGLGTWNNSAADALTLWNEHLDRVSFSWVLNSIATEDALDGYNSVFFSSTILGEGFGDDTLAATVVWYDTSDYGTAIEADVVFNIGQTFNSYRGPLLPGQYDFHRVALHEFGHVLGLAHVYDDPTGQAIMEPNISNLDHLAADDIAGVVFLYGYRITSPTELDGFVVGQPTTFFFSANNKPTSFSVVGLPQGLVLDPTTGKVTGTPLEAGTFQVTVTAHGSPQDVSAVVTIVIGAASITSTTSPDPIPIGTFFTYTITAANNPTSFTVTGLPEGIVYDSKTGVISGIPDLSGGFTANVVAHGIQYDAAGAVHFSVTPAYRQTIAQLPTADNTIRAIQDPVRDWLYVLNNRNVTVVDTDSLSIIATIPLMFAGYDLCLSPDNTTLWVIDAVGIHSYDLTSFSELPGIPQNSLPFKQIRAGLNNKLYVTDPPGGPGSYYEGLYELDPISGELTPIRLAGPGESIGAMIDASADGKYLYASFTQGTTSINRYDISSGAPVLLRSFVPPSASYLTALSVSPDGKHVSYSAQDQYVAKETTFSMANTLTGLITVLDPTAEFGTFNFGNPGTTGYFNTINNDGAGSYRLDFISTTTGLPFNKWELIDGGPAFADHAGKNLFVVRNIFVDVYSLASQATGGVTPAPKTLLNVSTRSVVGVDDQRMIGGFIITGGAEKEIAFRAIGPSLPLIGAMTDPKISIYDSTGALIATNHNWNQFRDAMISAGLDPFDEHDAGLVTTLAPGAYTAVVEIEDGSTGGVGLVELYDLSSDNSGRIANISTRSKVGTGDNVMIGGFIVGGDQVTNILARAIGPSLAGSVTGVLLDPVLELHDGNGVQIASNDDWRSDQQTEITATGVAPTDNRESAILVSLQPGPYTAIVRGKDETTGVGLVEIYNLDAAATSSK